MYLYIIILGKNYKIEEATKIFEYAKKELYKDKSNKLEKTKSLRQVQSIKEVSGATRQNFLTQLEVKKKRQQYKKKNTSVMSKLNNYIVTTKFFQKVIKNCELMIENEGKLNLKTIYFIINPLVYYIDKKNIENFFEEVDRSSSITKLKGFMKSINNFLCEVMFKYQTFKDNTDIKDMYETDFTRVDITNFCVAIVINIILLLFLNKKDSVFSITNILLVIISIVQVIFNLYFLSIYYRSKYKYNVYISQSEYENKKMNILDKLKVYVFDSFVLHQDTYFMILTIFMNILALISDNFTLLYSLELLSIVKFSKTIKIVLIAITSQVPSFLSIFGFLLIFIYFYANISFSFLRDQFVIETEGGKEENVCSSVLECTFIYFNHGLRSGGGIGDILSEVPYGTGKYWARFFNDFIFFILIILIVLNILLGVVVSFFLEMRKEENIKENDIKNNCFICNIDRSTFERNKIKFVDHKKFEHNKKLYIRFLVGLKLVNEKDLDAEQSYIVNCIKNEEIKVFPVGASSSIGFKNEKESNEEEEEEN
jgi:inositol 1,4,5-triphosphate receptor type 3